MTLDPVGLHRTFEPTPIAAGERQYVIESIGWVAPDRGAYPVEVVIYPEWDEQSPAADWSPGMVRYRLRAEAGQALDFAGLAQMDDASEEHGRELPLASLPANGVRYRLDARAVDVDIRVGYPVLLLRPVRIRVAIIPLRGAGPLCIVPNIDSWDPRNDPTDLQKPLKFPIGAREWRVTQSGMPGIDIDGTPHVEVDPDEIDINALAPFDGATVMSWTAGELSDWTPIPFEAYQWSVTGPYFVTAIYR
jgi:hypothetical protein